ncbi:KilA-N domain-containing protein [Flavobacterium ovatum]|uniref:KilA-N domain-containing protein n=1 Tax=Flavobacterium ovatum TaxID=1928857 RepID=UPI00344B3EE9
MDKIKQKVILNANGAEIAVLHFGDDNDYLSLTDIAKFKNPDDAFIVVNNWLRSKDTILFIGLWEQLNNPNFKPIEFDRFKNESGTNAFTLSPQKWISSTDAIGIVSKSDSVDF